MIRNGAALFSAKKGIWIFLFLVLSISLSAAPEHADPWQSAHTLRIGERDVEYLNYLLYLPSSYGKDPIRKWPLIVALHGSEERGNDPALVKASGLPALVEKNREFPFIVVSPQCPADQRWSPSWTKKLLDVVVKRFTVDRDRIYLTGYSMGGYGTWDTAEEYPELFAAIAPICGGGDTDQAGRIRGLPVWAFHGAKDPNVPVDESIQMVRALKRYGGEVKLTIYPEAEHDVWTVTYRNAGLYSWFLTHRKMGPAVQYLRADLGRRAQAGIQLLKSTVLIPMTVH